MYYKQGMFVSHRIIIAKPFALKKNAVVRLLLINRKAFFVSNVPQVRTRTRILEMELEISAWQSVGDIVWRADPEAKWAPCWAPGV